MRKPVRAASASITTRFWSAARWSGFGSATRLADPATAAAALAGGSGWACSRSYFLHPGNYVSMHENLMDLTHLTYLHANTIGTPVTPGRPMKLDLKEGHYRLVRHVLPTTLSPVWGRTTGLDGCPRRRASPPRVLSPGLTRSARPSTTQPCPPSGDRIPHPHGAHPHPGDPRQHTALHRPRTRFRLGRRDRRRFHATSNCSPPSSRTWKASARWKRYSRRPMGIAEISVASDAAGGHPHLPQAPRR